MNVALPNPIVRN